MTSHKATKSNVLLTLGVLFSIGGAARLLPANIAEAEKVNAASAIDPAPDSPAPAARGDTTDTPKVDANEVCFSGEAAALLSEDQWMFDSERDKLRQKEVELLAWQAELESQTTTLKALQVSLEARWKAMQAVSQDDLGHLARMYGSMKPDQAAEIFNKMDAGFAAGFLRQLSSDQAGQIMAAMDATKAYTVSVRLATLNSDLRSSSSKVE